MKVLFDHPWPFLLAHGGLQIQIEQTRAALERRGVEVDYLRWWDDRQTGQIIHYFGRPGCDYIKYAQEKGMKVVAAELLTGLGSRSAAARLAQKTLIRLAQSTLPKSFSNRLAWDAYRQADAFIALTQWEADLMKDMFDADPVKLHVVPNGVEEVFFARRLDSSPNAQSDYLVCTATIHPRKRVLELARAALLANVTVWIIGRPYAESDPYYLEFLAVQRQNPQFVRYEGGISDRARLAQIYREARGFVLLSTMESLSLSALEAAASKCPLLLSHLPWATTVFGNNAFYAKANASPEKLATVLRHFFDSAIIANTSFTPLTWDEVADKIVGIYEKLLE